MKTKWTFEQQQAIDTRGRTLLVSAAAGSGKTAVLTERAVKRMLDPENPVDADRLLVVTFTRAAASEMKARMSQKLSEYIAQNPQDEAARRQRTLLNRALIGTIDSLCLELLKENRLSLSLPASFRVGDKYELDAMRDETVEEVLEKAYQNGDDAAFFSLAALLSQKRGDQSLADAVLRILDFAMTHPFYTDWLDEKLYMYESFSAPEESVWGIVLLDYSKETAAQCLESAKEDCEEIKENSELENYSSAFSDDLDFWQRLCEKLKQNSWDGTQEVLNGYRPQRLRPLPRSADKQRSERLKAARDRRKKAAAKLCNETISATLAEFKEDVDDLLPKIRRLFELVKETDALLMQKKMTRGIFSFADMEQLAVSLLVEKGEGALRKSELARQISERFDEVMVDECQDVNTVQDMIFTALSSSGEKGGNLFMVGDVKQSIYRFRQAKPEIFISRCEQYKNGGDGGNSPRLITLGGNFRSRCEITEAVNQIFKRLFSKRIGELIYDESHELIAKTGYPIDLDAGMQLHLLEQGQLSAKQASAGEAAYTADMIKKLLDDKTLISDKGTLRSVRPGDIAVLLRSPKNKAKIWCDALQKRGISTLALLESGFLKRAEVTALTNFLRALNNPTSDIELIGAMLSPMFGFSDDEIADIRLCGREGHFYFALLKGAETMPRAGAFLQRFEELRALSLTVCAADLITAVIDSTGFDVICRAMPDGKQRALNLAQLASYAEQFSQGKNSSLAAFLAIIDRIEERGEDLAPAYCGEELDAVTVVSIHRSKGLEWPVVFLCDAGSDFSFYRNDLVKPTILNSEMGFACVRREEDTARQYPALPLLAVRIESARAALSEELRVLYVAATRAKERFIVTAARKKTLALVEELSTSSTDLSPAVVRGAKCYAEWIIMALSCCGDVERAMNSGKKIQGIAVKQGFLEKYFLQEQGKPNREEVQLTLEAAAELNKKQEFSQNEKDIYESVKKRLDFTYPFALAAASPAKLSVSQISHAENSADRFFSQMPSFIAKEQSGAAKKGTATHSFMQYCDYAAAKRSAESELQRLCSLGILTGEQAELIDLKKVEAFFASALYRRIESAEGVLREYPFMVSAAEVEAASGLVCENREAPMLQGIADCVIIEKDGVCVVDYKTDNVKDAKTLKERYYTQLLLYKQMLLKTLGKSVLQCVIWSFALGCEITVL